MNFTLSEIKKSPDGYEFQVLDNGNSWSEYFIDIDKNIVSWFSEWDSGTAFFNLEEEAQSFAINKVKELYQNAIETEKNIICG